MNKALERIQRLLPQRVSWRANRCRDPASPSPAQHSCSSHNRIPLLPLGEVEFVHSDLAGNKVVSAQQQAPPS